MSHSFIHSAVVADGLLCCYTSTKNDEKRERLSTVKSVVQEMAPGNISHFLLVSAVHYRLTTPYLKCTNWELDWKWDI